MTSGFIHALGASFWKARALRRAAAFLLMTPCLAALSTAELKALIEKHAEATGSANAKRILTAWDTARARFIKVIPKDYKRVLACLKRWTREKVWLGR